MLANCDLGDWIGAEGEAITSRRGELSVDVTELWLLSKALRPLPDKWHGLTETDTRYRQREVDLLANPDSRRVFDIRFKAIAALRRQLVAEDFVEVDTPILQPQAGGALARPFMTHANALDIDLSLRIAPELYLKRLVVGGYERVFEIARNFRNEGVDTRHSPEFTALEAYRAFGDVNDGMELTERLIVEAARSATGRLDFTVGERAIDLTPPWPRRQLLDWLEEVVGRRLHPSRPGRRGPGRLREARRRLPARVGFGKAHLRALRHHSAAHGGRPGVRVRVPGRGVAAGPPHRTTTRRWPTGSSWPSTPRSSPTATASSTSPRSNRSGSGAKPRRWPGATSRPTRPTWPSCGPSSTACRPPRVSASASTG